MGRYDHLKEKKKQPKSKIKIVQKISMILLLVLAFIGLLVQLVIYLKK